MGKNDKNSGVAVVAPETLEQAIEIIAALNAEKDAIATELEAANAELDSAKGELDSVKTELEAANTELDSAKADLVKASSAIEELMQANANAPSVVAGNTLVHDKVKYTIVTPSFYYKGKKVTVADLQKNKKLVAELLEENTGNLVPEKGSE